MNCTIIRKKGANMIKKADEKHLADIMKLLKEVGNIHADLRNDLFIKDQTKYSRL